uniref:Tail specific protease domain-containing protein n=1 Tax=Bionectria ochroleuca TaxID=29856 RepID=A0A8H7N2W7_BIOOC
MGFRTLLVMAISTMHLAISTTAQNLHPCAAIAKAQLEASAGIQLPRPGDLQLLAPFDAETAYQCAISVPLHAQEATEMMQITKQYVSFMSTLAYLKNPPKSYQQPAVDVMERLEEIINNIAQSVYANQYELDMALHSIAITVHDTHFIIPRGVMNIFQWFLPDSIVTLSSDGQELPQVYAYSDILNKVDSPSPIVEIGGESVFTYLRSYIARTAAIGVNDPHAEWNRLMFSPAFSFGQTGVSNQKTSYFDYFQSTLVYNGPVLKGRFANQTEFTWAYTAGSELNLTDFGLLSGSDIYKKFILNPASNQTTHSLREVSTLEPSISKTAPSLGDPPSMERRSSSASSIALKVPFDSYPADPVVMQQNFTEGGTVSGYFLTDQSTGVLSLPTFAMDKPVSFSDAVSSFIKKAKEAGMKKIVIDLSGNGGGNVLLGYDVFKQFFPAIEPRLAWRTRASPSLNTIGSLMTRISGDDGSVFPEELILSAWHKSAIFAAINAEFTLDTNYTKWASWNEFYGPHQIYGDNFTTPGFYNLSSVPFTATFGRPITGYGDLSTDLQQPWAAEDIILLQDGYCGSTCSLFSNIMKNDAGVKSVVVGGIPQYGPMQGVCGTRGSNVLKWSDLGTAIDIIKQNISSSQNDYRSVLQDLELTDGDLNGLPTSPSLTPWKNAQGAINALDEINLFNTDVPRQFVYEAADCRLFYTADMIQDITQLWRTAGSFAMGNTSICVPDSTKGPGSGINETITGYSGFSYNETWEKANSTNRSRHDGSADGDLSLGVINRVGLLTLAVVVISILL